MLEHAGGFVTDDMLAELQSDAQLKAAITAELELQVSGPAPRSICRQDCLAERFPTQRARGRPSDPGGPPQRTGAYGTHFIGAKKQRQWVWPWSTDVENAREDSLEFAPERAGKTVWDYVYDIMVHPEEPHGGVLVRPLYNYGECAGVYLGIPLAVTTV